VPGEWTSLIGRRATPGDRRCLFISSRQSARLSIDCTRPVINGSFTGQSGVTMSDFHTSLSINSSGGSSGRLTARVPSRLDTASLHPFSIDAIIGGVTSSSATNWVHDHVHTGYLNIGT